MDIPGPRIYDVSSNESSYHNSIDDLNQNGFSNSISGSIEMLNYNQDLIDINHNNNDALNSDISVQSTDNDALDCRISASSLGYFEDPYAVYFSRKKKRNQFKSTNKVNRLQPVINRGTYCRTKFINSVCMKFFESVDLLKQKKLIDNTNNIPQIISLGAGSDTRYFNLLKNKLDYNCKYFEIDFPETTANKIKNIIQKSELKDLILNSNPNNQYKLLKGGTGFYSDNYTILPGDLRDFDNIINDLYEYGYNNNAPTLIICECLFLYLEESVTNMLLKNIQDKLIQNYGLVVSYDPINPNTPFGKTMIYNLSQRGIFIPGIKSFPSLISHSNKYLNNGFNFSYSYEMTNYWNIINENEKLRLNKIEMLDEIEEWNLLLSSYCISYGIISKNQSNNWFISDLF